MGRDGGGGNKLEYEMQRNLSSSAVFAQNKVFYKHWGKLKCVCVGGGEGGCVRACCCCCWEQSVRVRTQLPRG